MVAADAVSVSGALWMAFALKYDSLTHEFQHEVRLYAGAVTASLLLYWAFGLYRSVIRYMGPRALLSIFGGAIGSALSLYLLGLTFIPPAVPASVAVIYAMIALAWVGGSRALARLMLLPKHESGEAVAVYGAGEAGVQLAHVLNQGDELKVIGFFDDKGLLKGTVIDGMPVWPSESLADIISERSLSRVLIALPSASRRRRSEIIHRLDDLGVRVQLVPDIADIASGRAHVDELREVEVADLLGRDQVAPDPCLLGRRIRGKSVMVSGGGGSIGSELCRQIIRLQPTRLVIFEKSEVALYEIESELRNQLREAGTNVELVGLLGDVHDRIRVRDAMRAYAVQTVYHAAAYKHVPIVERNVIDGIRNNVFGTLHAAEAAMEAGVEAFVLISTDKAVNPTNVMGATKRMSELVLQALQERGSRTLFCMVRFGNVLDSSGSVVPLFRRQIREGGPVTVTHPEVIRYFMTIPEASQLVLQAGSMARGGEVFVLDMGKPVCILDLAQRMVRLSGLTVRDEANPDGDIEIAITGLRPGEKLYEELLIGCDVAETDHPRIMRAREHSLPWARLEHLLGDLQTSMTLLDVPTTRALLCQAVPEYRPSTEEHDSVWAQAHHAQPAAAIQATPPAASQQAA